ncbi:MAG TPA: hypothetical protein ENN13_02625, partial [Candidatus Altiarchaeales archaeon]|nr:hypothetical protein [Candidatus Altiarchaeales archaeon]
MSKSIRKSLMEVRASHLSIHFYQLMFDFLIAFVVSIILVRITGLSLAYVLIPFIVLALSASVYEFRKWNLIDLIERSYESLDERLETAYEADEGNPIADSLIREVRGEIDGIEDSSFMNPKFLFGRIAVLFVLCLILLTAGFVGFYFDLDRILEDPNVGGVK